LSQGTLNENKKQSKKKKNKKQNQRTKEPWNGQLVMGFPERIHHFINLIARINSKEKLGEKKK
jgi:hypothetical protein